MMKILSKGGLDPKYWMERFKNIGATTQGALKFLGPSHFDELSKFAEKPIEIAALKTFLGMPDDGKLLSNVSIIVSEYT